MKLSKANNVLLVLIIAVNAYTILAPLYPALVYKLHEHGDRRQQLSQAIARPASPAKAQPNHLIIPDMLLDEPVREAPISRQYEALNKGIWRWPRGSTPDKGGNTVLIGHRFTYTDPNGVFYHLDKLKAGSNIGVVWNNHTYTYRVRDTKVVRPTDTAIQNPTRDSRLTLFTCAPLWLPKNRLVVTALEVKP